MNKESPYFDELIMIKSQFNQLNKENRIGVIDNKESRIEINRLNKSIIDLSKKVFSSNDIGFKSEKGKSRKIIIFSLAALLLISFAYVSITKLLPFENTSEQSEKSQLNVKEGENALPSESTSEKPEKTQLDTTKNKNPVPSKSMSEKPKKPQLGTAKNENTLPEQPEKFQLNTIEDENTLTLIYSSKKLKRKDTFRVSRNEKVESIREALKRHFEIKLQSKSLQRYDYAKEYLIANHNKLSDNLTLLESGVKDFDIIQYELEYRFRTVDACFRELLIVLDGVKSSNPILVIDNAFKGMLMEQKNNIAKFRLTVECGTQSINRSYRLIDNGKIYEFQSPASNSDQDDYDIEVNYTIK